MNLEKLHGHSEAVVTLQKQADMTSSFILIRNLKSALNYTFCWPYNPLDAGPGLGATNGYFFCQCQETSSCLYKHPGGYFQTLNVYDYPIAFL